MTVPLCFLMAWPQCLSSWLQTFSGEIQSGRPHSRAAGQRHVGQERHRQRSGGGHDTLCSHATPDRGALPRLDGTAGAPRLGQRLVQALERRCRGTAAPLPRAPAVPPQLLPAVFGVCGDYGRLYDGAREQQRQPRPDQQQQHPTWSCHSERKPSGSWPRTLECLDYNQTPHPPTPHSYFSPTKWDTTDAEAPAMFQRPSTRPLTRTQRTCRCWITVMFPFRRTPPSVAVATGRISIQNKRFFLSKHRIVRYFDLYRMCIIAPVQGIACAMWGAAAW